MPQPVNAEITRVKIARGNATQYMANSGGVTPRLSFYGRLSVASMNVDELRSGDLPPTFYCYGTEDPFYRQFEAQYDLMQDVGVLTKRIVLQDWPHGFGGDGGWVEDYAQWLEQIFGEN